MASTSRGWSSTESRVSASLRRSTSETLSLGERASVRTTKSKSAAVNRARQFALIIASSFIINDEIRIKLVQCQQRRSVFGVQTCTYENYPFHPVRPGVRFDFLDVAGVCVEPQPSLRNVKFGF